VLRRDSQQLFGSQHYRLRRRFFNAHAPTKRENQAEGMRELTCLFDCCVLPGARLIEIAEPGQRQRQMAEAHDELIARLCGGGAAKCGIGQREQFLL